MFPEVNNPVMCPPSPSSSRISSHLHIFEDFPPSEIPNAHGEIPILMAFTSINVFIQITQKKQGHWTRFNHWSQNGNSWTLKFLKAICYMFPSGKTSIYRWFFQWGINGVPPRSRSARRCADLAPEARDFFLSEEAKLRFLAKLSWWIQWWFHGISWGYHWIYPLVI